MRAAAAALLLLLQPAALGSQTLAMSPGPETVMVSIYRGARGGELDLEWLQGYALITETRTVDLPAGPSEIRFEGVAGGIIPVSAIVSGLPGGAIEKNRDARLLSPGGLVDAVLGRRVHVRRTSRATGRVTETEAILRSGPEGVVLQTPDGIEALRCTGLPETLVYQEAPEGLTARPTLAVRTVTPVAARATVRLSYLATDFDWRANYVINMAPDGKTLDLFAWLTLANGNAESFPAAQTNAIAGSPNKEEEDELGESSVPTLVSLQCWPAGTTSDSAVQRPSGEYQLQEMQMTDGADMIVVTASRAKEAMYMSASPLVVVTAEQEELGDLKLYRIPEPVTVAANAQKQVALLTKPRVRFERLYGADLSTRSDVETTPVAVLLRLKNEKKNGLGVPLPAGVAAVFETVAGRPILAGETRVDDTAVGQELDLRTGESIDVRIAQRKLAARQVKRGKDEIEVERYEIELSNAGARPAIVETLLRIYGDWWQLVRPSAKLGTRNGRRFWRAKVPANGRVKLVYEMETVPASPEVDEEDEEGEE